MLLPPSPSYPPRVAVLSHRAPPAPSHDLRVPESFSTPRLDVQPLSPEEAPRLQGVFERAGDYFLGITGRPAPEADAAEREIRACHEAEGREIALLVLRDGGEPVGALGWWKGMPEPGVALLGMLLLAPEHRRQGFAREVVEALGCRAAQEGCDRLRTAVAFRDQRAQEVLRALGFQPLDQRTHVSVADRGRLMISFFEKPVSPCP